MSGIAKSSAVETAELILNLFKKYGPMVLDYVNEIKALITNGTNAGASPAEVHSLIDQHLAAKASA